MLFDLQNSPSDYLEYRFEGQTGATPLHVAAANGYLSVVEYLVKALCMAHITYMAATRIGRELKQL